MDDNFVKALGRVVVRFSSLEIYLSFFIWTLIGSDLNIGKAITSDSEMRWYCE